MHNLKSEPELVAERYACRQSLDDRYSMLNPAVWQSVQERQRVLINFLIRHVRKPLNKVRVLEVGCGSGGNLLELLRMGFAAENLFGIELLPERATLARHNLPAATILHEGDAATLPLEAGGFDIVYQSTVFTSLLSTPFQEKLAAKMWDWVCPGGGILWYDFIYNNPINPDVRGVPPKRVQELFPEGRIIVRRVTLAPPISRRVCRIHPAAYHLLNAIPCLRTHILCWIGKEK